MRVAIVSAGTVPQAVLERIPFEVIVVRSRDYRPESVREALKGISYDVAILPGGVPYDYSSVPRAVKGTISIYALPYVLRTVSVDLLSPSKPAEKALGRLMVSVARAAMEEMRGAVAFRVSAAEIPLRPPPMLVASDIYVRAGSSPAEVAEEAQYREREGADIVVLSADPHLEPSEYLKALRATVTSISVPVAADAIRPEVMSASVEAGAQIVLSLTPSSLHTLPREVRERSAIVMIPDRLGGWRERVEDLAKGLERARELGYDKVLLDPVVNPAIYPGSLESFIAAKELSALCDAPLFMGLNNAVEMMDVDTHASVATLTFLAAEAGVSVVMVGEESYKARGNTGEAKISSWIASAALSLRTPPKDLGVNVLWMKGKEPPEGSAYLGRGTAMEGGKKVRCLEEGEGMVCLPWRLRSSLFPS